MAGSGGQEGSDDLRADRASNQTSITDRWYACRSGAFRPQSGSAHDEQVKPTPRP